MSRKLKKTELRQMRSGRPSARKLETIVEGTFRTMWVPRLGGFNVSENGIWKFANKVDAVNAARRVPQRNN